MVTPSGARAALLVAFVIGQNTGTPQALSFQLPARADAATHPREVNLVVVDADNGRPVQALKIGC